MEENSFTCPVCGGKELVTRENMVLCSYCGMIVRERRYADTPSLKTLYLIGREDSIRSFGRIGLDTRTSQEYRFYRYKEHIKELGDALKLPTHIVGEALKLASLVAKGSRGISGRIVAIICIVEAARSKGYPISYRRMFDIVEKKYGVKTYRKKLFRSLLTLSSLGIGKTQIDPTSLITNIIEKIGRDEEVTRRIRESQWDKEDYISMLLKTALEIYSKYRRFFMGKSSKTIAALLIYLSDIRLSHEYSRRRVLTQKLLSSFTDVSSYTIRERAIEFYRFTGDPLYRVRKRGG